MASHSFGAFIDIESAPIRGPEPALSRPWGSKPASTVQSPAPRDLELEDYFNWGGQPSGAATPSAAAGTLPQTPYTGAHTPAALLASQQPNEVTTIVPTWRDPYMNRWRFLSCCVVYMVGGMNDSAVGALIPYMESHYSIGYAIVSLIFVGQAVGFIGAAFFTHAMSSRFGQAKTFVYAQMLMAVAFGILISTPPYPAVVVAFLLIGWSFAISLALSNVFCSNLAGSSVMLGIGHGAYGVGGIIGPFVATALVSRGTLWSRYYIVTLVLVLVAAVFSGWAFKGIESEASHQLHQALEETANRRVSLSGDTTSKRRLLLQALAYRATLIGALFTFAYQGAEVSISGWVISFLITERQGDPKTAGFVTAGFWGGITIGRFVLPYLFRRLSPKHFVHALSVLAIAFQLLVWLVPNVIGDSVAVALVGLVLGPVAPISISYLIRLMPKTIQTTGVGFVSSAGSSGGAVVPFMVGLLAQARGTWVLHPVCISFFVVMAISWFFLPTVEKRTE